MMLKVKKKSTECEISPENRAGKYSDSHVPVSDQILGRTSYWMKRIFWIWEYRPEIRPNLDFARPYACVCQIMPLRNVSIAYLRFVECFL